MGFHNREWETKTKFTTDRKTNRDDFWKKEKVHARAPTFQGIKNLDRVTGISLGKYQESRQNESVEVAQMSLSLILDWYLSSNSIMLPFLFSVF